MVSLVYFNRVLDITSQCPEMRRSLIGIAKQTGYAAGGAMCGGIVAGPPGALIGTVFGAIIGYMNADEYDSLLAAVQRLSDDEKYRLQQKIQELVGGVTVEEFVRWLQAEGHRQLLLNVLNQATSAA